MDEAAVRTLYEVLARIISLREGVSIRVVRVSKKTDSDKIPPDAGK